MWRFLNGNGTSTTTTVEVTSSFISFTSLRMIIRLCGGYHQSAFCIQGQRPVPYQRWSKAIDWMPDKNASYTHKQGLKARTIRILFAEP